MIDCRVEKITGYVAVSTLREVIRDRQAGWEEHCVVL
jgi:hypothetical protein